MGSSRSKRTDPARNAIAKGKPVFQGRVVSKKKQKQHDRAVKMEKRWLAAKGLIEAEEEMTDVVVSSASKVQMVVVTVPDEVLAAAAAGPGTTLGQPQ